MKILFIEPIADFIPVRHGFYCPNNGILALAAYLEQHQYEVKIVDPYILRIDWRGVLERLKQERPQVICMSAYTYNAYNCMAMARLIKDYFPKVTIIVGGIHFSAMPEESLHVCKSIDYIIRGEGEITLLELIRNLEDGKSKKSLGEVKGLAYLRDGEYLQTSPRPFVEYIDSLPIPAYHLLSLKERKIPLAGRDTMGCSFSRGCVYRCTFCSSTQHWRGIVRRKSAQRIGEEIELLVRQYNKNLFVFGDDDFLHNQKENIEFLDEIKKRKLNIKYVIRTRIDDIIRNREYLEEFSKSGLISVALGIERFQQKDISDWRKQYNVGDIEHALYYLKKAKIPLIEMYLIFGLPEDNKRMWRDTVTMIKKLNQPVFLASLLTPLPGTSLFREKYKDIKVWDYRKYDFMHGIIPTRFLSTQEMEDLIWKTFFFWWLTPASLLFGLSNIYRWRYYLFRLLMHIRGGYKFMQFLIRKMRRKQQSPYALTVEEMCRKHHHYIGRESEQERRASLFGGRWGFKMQ